MRKVKGRYEKEECVLIFQRTRKRQRKEEKGRNCIFLTDTFSSVAQGLVNRVKEKGKEWEKWEEMRKEECVLIFQRTPFDKQSERKRQRMEEKGRKRGRTCSDLSTDNFPSVTEGLVNSERKKAK